MVRAFMGCAVLAALATSAYFHARALMALLPSARGIAAQPRATSVGADVNGEVVPKSRRALLPASEGPLANSGRVPEPIVITQCRGLWATIVSESSDPAASMVALKTDSEPRARVCRVGDTVAGWRVELIGFNHRDSTPSVWFSRGRSACRLDLFAQPGPTALVTAAAESPRRPASRVPPELAARIRRVSESEVRVERAAVEAILEDPSAVMKELRVVPERRNDRTLGLRLARVQSDGILALLGLREGDILQTVNGFDVANPERALEAFARLRVAPRLDVRIERAQRPLRIDYSIE